MFIQVVDHHLGDHIPLQLENNSDRLIRLIAGVTDPLQFFLLHQFGHPLDQLLRVHIVGNFRNHQLLLTRTTVLNRDLAPKLERSTPSLVVRRDRLLTANQRTGREIRPRHDLQDLLCR